MYCTSYLIKFDFDYSSSLPSAIDFISEIDNTEDLKTEKYLPSIGLLVYDFMLSFSDCESVSNFYRAMRTKMLYI